MPQSYENFSSYFINPFTTSDKTFIFLSHWDDLKTNLANLLSDPSVVKIISTKISELKNCINFPNVIDNLKRISSHLPEYAELADIHGVSSDMELLCYCMEKFKVIETLDLRLSVSPDDQTLRKRVNGLKELLASREFEIQGKLDEQLDKLLPIAK